MKLIRTTLIILGITTLLIELSSYFLFESKIDKSFSYQEIQQDRTQRTSILEKNLNKQLASDSVYAFHPYIGYTGRPGIHPWGEEAPSFNQYGMFSVQGFDYPYTKKDNEYVIAIVGGSVAEIFSNLALLSVNQYLDNYSDFDKDIVFINLATAGHKQPQQLFHLLYALLSGFQFDAVINIDGFNEMALGNENVKRGINPIFPSGFHMGLMSSFTSNKLDKKLIQQLSLYYSLIETELSVLSTIENSILRYSVFANFFGELWTARFIRKTENLKVEIAEQAQRGMAKEYQGPEFSPGETSYETIVGTWQKSSEAIHRIAKHNQMLYLHILQPNQYIEGSKTLSTEEKAMTEKPHTWGIFARTGYPYLQSRGKVLREKGIAFYDMSMVFKNVSETLYTDNCCHFNQRGNDLFGEAIAEALINEWKTQ